MRGSKSALTFLFTGSLLFVFCGQSQAGYPAWLNANPANAPRLGLCGGCCGGCPSCAAPGCAAGPCAPRCGLIDRIKASKLACHVRCAAARLCDPCACGCGSCYGIGCDSCGYDSCGCGGGGCGGGGCSDCGHGSGHAQGAVYPADGNVPYGGPTPVDASYE